MMHTIRLTASRKMLAIVFILLGLLVTTLQAPMASAAIRTCRTDPIVTLSNGYSFHITATLATDASNVRSIVYTVRVPKGVTLTKLTYTGGSLLNKEKLVFYSDQVAGTYIIDTVATTGTANVATMATISIGSQSRSVSGLSGTHLTMQFNNVP